MLRPLLLLLLVASSSCTFGAPSTVVVPGKVGRLRAAATWELPYAPARAWLQGTYTKEDADGNRHTTFGKDVVAGNAASAAPTSQLAFFGLMPSATLSGFLTATSNLTLGADISVHRAGAGAHWFFDPEASHGRLKVAIGLRSGTFERELWGWAEFGSVLRVDQAAEIFVGLRTSAGRFRHWMPFDSVLTQDPEQDGWPGAGPLLDIFRTELRVNTPLGIVVKGRQILYLFVLTPYVTPLHGNARLHNCVECDRVEMVAFEQRAGLSFEFGIQTQ